MSDTAIGVGRRMPRQPAEHFQDLETQRHAAQLGMWIFLSGEVLLFSAMFALYGGLRVRWHAAFARGAGETVLWMGTSGTVTLLFASFLVALAVHAIREDRERAAGALVWGAAALGAAFLVLKFWEYAKHLHAGLAPGAYVSGILAGGSGEDAFWTLYYVMTGAHALHVIGGIVLLVWLGRRARRGDFDASYHTPLELGGMYWHLVDVVWLFLWPFFYLMRS